MTDYEPTRLFAGAEPNRARPAADRLRANGRVVGRRCAWKWPSRACGCGNVGGLPRRGPPWRESTGAFVIAEATRENLAELLERLSWLDRDFPLVRAAAVAERESGAIRMAGARGGRGPLPDFASTPGAAGPAGSPAPGERAGAGAVACAADLGDTTLAAAGRVEWLPPCRCLSPNPPSAMSCPDFRTPKPAVGRCSFEQFHRIELRDGRLAVTLGLTIVGRAAVDGNRRGTGGHAADPLSRTDGRRDGRRAPPPGRAGGAARPDRQERYRRGRGQRGRRQKHDRLVSRLRTRPHAAPRLA